MSSYALNESVRTDPQPGLEGAWHGRIARGATSLNDRVWVTIPGFDPGKQIGPCRWMVRDPDSLPQRGDPCLVIFDDQQEGWIPVWGPYQQ